MPIAPTPEKRCFALVRHTARGCGTSLELTAALTRTDAEQLQIRYRLAGNLSSILLPTRNNSPTAVCGLWRHTCFETFVADAHGPGYHEFNFSPSGNWAAYAFSAPRQRRPDSGAALQPRIAIRAAPGEFILSARLPLPASARDGAVALGLSAVVEHDDGRRCYWALAHPCEDPDFHARSSWLATLPPA